MYMMMIQIIIIIIIMQCNNSNFNGKCWVVLVFGTKLSRTCGDPNYRGPNYRGTTVYIKTTHAI